MDYEQESSDWTCSMQNRPYGDISVFNALERGKRRAVETAREYLD